MLKIKNNELILNLGKQPVTNQFTKVKNKNNKKYNLKIVQEKKTGLIKILKPFPVSSLVPNVSWIKYNEPEDHLDSLYSFIKKKYLNKNSNLLGLSYKDDSLINRFKKKKYSANVLDPLTDLGLKKNQGIETIQNSLNQNKVNKIIDKYGKQDLLIIRHVWEHVYNLGKFANYIKQLIHKNGLILFEVPDYSKLLKNNDYTMIWEEHLFYFNKFTFLNSLRQFNFFIRDCKKIVYPNEDVLIAIVSVKDSVKINNSKIEILKINSLANQFKNNYNKQKKNIHNKLAELSENKKIIMYGAGHLGVSFILYFDLKKYITIILDDNKLKNNYFMPGTDIKIKFSKQIKSLSQYYILISANQINENKMIKKLIEKKGKKNKIFSIFSTSKIFIGK